MRLQIHLICIMFELNFPIYTYTQLYENLVSFSISVRWSIYIINSVDKPNFRVSLPHRRSTTVSIETNPLYTQLYKAIQSYTDAYKAIQGYTGLYTAIQTYTGLYRPIQGYTQLYKAMLGYTELFTAIHGCTELYRPIQGYTLLYKAIQNYTGL